MKFAAALAAPLAAVCSALPLLVPWALTADAAVAAAMRSIAPFAGGAILLCTIDVASEGLLVAGKRLRLLLGSMTGVLGAVGTYFWAGKGMSLQGTWGGLVLFFGLRCAVSVGAVVRTLLREDKAKNKSLYGVKVT
jgi:hypothetical protein